MSNRSNIGFAFLGLILITACSPQRRIAETEITGSEQESYSRNICDTIEEYNSLYVSKISAEITLDEEKYDTRLSVYYIPDTIFYISAVNAGFEIVRIGVTPDSTVYINRLDKFVYIYKSSELGYPPPVSFEDFEYLMNQKKACKAEKVRVKETNLASLDRSLKDVEKLIYYDYEQMRMEKFEFFQKKTGEYVVGERRKENSYLIYSNYIMDNLTIEAEGGEIERNKKLEINLSVNKRKYDILYF